MVKPNEIDKAVFVVTKKMCEKVYPVINREIRFSSI